MKKINDIEKKFYEILGVKLFKKIVMFIYDIIAKIISLSLPKQYRKAFLKSKGTTNYTIGSIKSLDNIKKFKKELLFNGFVHICGAIIALSFLGESILNKTPSILPIALNSTFLGINIYCVMLQRYNYIRIKKVIEKAKPKYEEQKEKIREDLRKRDKYLLDKEFQKHAYKIVTKRKEKEFNLEEKMAKADIEQLKLYRQILETLDYMKEDAFDDENLINDEQIDLSVELSNNKTFKLEIYNNKKNRKL